MRKTNLINKRAVRKMILDAANAKFPPGQLQDTYTDSSGTAWDYSRANQLMSTKNKGFNRVSSDVYSAIEQFLKNRLRFLISNIPHAESTVKLHKKIVIETEGE